MRVTPPFINQPIGKGHPWSLWGDHLQETPIQNRICITKLQMYNNLNYHTYLTLHICIIYIYMIYAYIFIYYTCKTHSNDPGCPWPSVHSLLKSLAWAKRLIPKGNSQCHSQSSELRRSTNSRNSHRPNSDSRKSHCRILSRTTCSMKIWFVNPPNLFAFFLSSLIFNHCRHNLI